MKLKVDLRVPLGLSIPRVVEFIQWCETVGLNGVAIHDHPESGRDLYAALTLAAGKTSNIDLYTGVTNGITRHPTVLACLANSLQEIAPGRIKLVVGRGDIMMRLIGLQHSTLEELRYTVTTLRKLLAGEPVAFGSNPSLRLDYISAPATPIYIACSGPRVAELAGEIGDGVYIQAGLNPEMVDAARRHIAIGAQRAGRDPATIPVIFMTPIHIDSDLEAARRWAIDWLYADTVGSRHPALFQGPRWMADSNRYWFQQAGITLPKDFRDTPDETLSQVCDGVGLFGPPEYCAERLARAREESRVDHVCLFTAHLERAYDPQGTPQSREKNIPDLFLMPEAEVRAFESAIGPRVLV
jgi:5,10-methylenetetrahydromethanopterin reductase